MALPFPGSFPPPTLTSLPFFLLPIPPFPFLEFYNRRIHSSSLISILDFLWGFGFRSLFFQFSTPWTPPLPLSPSPISSFTVPPIPSIRIKEFHRKFFCISLLLYIPYQILNRSFIVALETGFWFISFVPF